MKKWRRHAFRRCVVEAHLFLFILHFIGLQILFFVKVFLYMYMYTVQIKLI